MLNCPYCNSENVVKNGSNSSDKQKFMCKNCNRQFVENPENIIISRETENFIDLLLLEKIPPAGIARVTGVSERWLQYYVKDKYENIPQKIKVTKKEKGRLTIECDEMWSFVGRKGNNILIWFAKDIDTGEIVGVHAGSRDREGAQQLWNSLPAVYRQCAVSYTDFRSAYEEVFPSERHCRVGKESGKTNSVESFNCTVRQRISGLVRKTLSFSKKIANHIGAIWYFVHRYNASLA